MNSLVNLPKDDRGMTERRRRSNLSSFPAWIDDIFNNEIPSIIAQNFNSGLTLPRVNVRETADEYFVEMAVPGMKKSDFNIELDNHNLLISTEKTEEKEDTEENYMRREFGYSSFKRSFSLPETIEDEKIKAEYKDGILSVHIPKKEEAKQKPPRNIDIS